MLYVAERGSCTVDRQLAQIAVASVTNPKHTRYPTRTVLARCKPK